MPIRTVHRCFGLNSSVRREFSAHRTEFLARQFYPQIELWCTRPIRHCRHYSHLFSLNLTQHTCNERPRVVGIWYAFTLPVKGEGVYTCRSGVRGRRKITGGLVVRCGSKKITRVGILQQFTCALKKRRRQHYVIPFIEEDVGAWNGASASAYVPVLHSVHESAFERSGITRTR